MAEHLTAERVRSALRGAESITDPFRVLQDISIIVNNPAQEHVGRELVLRCLERREEFSELDPILKSLTLAVGLYPYVESSDIGVREALDYEFHRPLNMDEDLVFHREQAGVYRRLLAGDSIVLSAPTSFGKSRIIDAMIAIQKFNNIAIIVPTIALIDETRRRLSKFSAYYKVVSHLSQQPAEHNLFVFTQERLIAYKGLPKIDFFVIDEFYKLGGLEEEQDRKVALNHAFHLLLEHGAQFYLLGPNIHELDIGSSSRVEFHFVRTDFATVVAEQSRLRRTKSKADKQALLLELCDDLDEPTLIYCQSPNSVNQVARLLMSKLPELNDSELDLARTWVSANYHPEWVFAQAIAHGIGIHHGRLPRALSQFSVRAFNKLQLRFLVCTSTLIEGVNTKAKNVVIYDNKVANKNIDYFTFNNIKGRSGRMFEHFVGRVFLFDAPPQQELPFVDFPLFKQDVDTPDSLLIQISDENLTDSSRERIKWITEQNLLSLETLRENAGISPESQLRLALAIKKSPREDLLVWTGFPTWDQHAHVCGIIWEFLVEGEFRNGIASGGQLAYMIWHLRDGKSTSDRVAQELLPGKYAAKSPDEAVERVLLFDRNWAGFDFPRLLMTVSRIQAEIMLKAGKSGGDYSFFAAQVECHFGAPEVAAMDEFGIPVQVGKKVLPYVQSDGDLDQVIEKLRVLDVPSLNLEPFEQLILQDAVRDV